MTHFTLDNKPTVINKRKDPFAFTINRSDATKDSSLLLDQIEMLFSLYRVDSPALLHSPLHHVGETGLYILSNHLFPVIRAYTTINSFLLQSKQTASLHMGLASFANFNINMLISDNILRNDNRLSEEDYIHFRALFINKAIRGLLLLYKLLTGLQSHLNLKFTNEVSYIRSFIKEINQLLVNAHFSHEAI